MENQSKSRLAARSLEVSLTTANLATSVQWYCDVLGFLVKKEYARDDVVFAVALESGNVQILLTQDDGARGLDRPKGEGFSFQITTDQDIDALADFARSAGAVLDTEPVDLFPGKRVFRLRDPNGFRIAVSSNPPK
jgi:catechol 2,3-dioxygenase-like lactoylglutathione lyase family enzyme